MLIDGVVVAEVRGATASVLTALLLSSKAFSTPLLFLQGFPHTSTSSVKILLSLLNPNPSYLLLLLLLLLPTDESRSRPLVRMIRSEIAACLLSPLTFFQGTFFTSNQRAGA